MLTNAVHEAIANSVVKRRYRRGELVVERGKKSNALFILAVRRVRVLRPTYGHGKFILSVLEAGSVGVR